MGSNPTPSASISPDVSVGEVLTPSPGPSPAAQWRGNLVDAAGGRGRVSWQRGCYCLESRDGAVCNVVCVWVSCGSSKNSSSLLCLRAVVGSVPKVPDMRNSASHRGRARSIDQIFQFADPGVPTVLVVVRGARRAVPRRI